ncbi:MAG: hypothetical protein HYY31_05060 [Chloroflexi bacterium]|nr:hypothetical protein [Chloroflexota bacterium]
MGKLLGLDLRNEWVRLAIALAAGGAILFLVMLPTQVFGLGAAITSAKSSYKLGEKVVLTADGTLGVNETKDFQNVTLEVTGPEPFTLNGVPLAPIDTTINLNSLLSAGFVSAGGSCSVVIAHVDLSYLGAGYGYGYGYQGTSAASKIRWVFGCKIPPLKLTAPEGLPATLPATTVYFPVPGAQAAAGPEAVAAEFAFEVPGAFIAGSTPDDNISVPAGSTPLGLEYGNIAAISFTALAILVDTNPDVVLFVDPTYGYVYGAANTGVDTAEAVALDNSGNVWVAFTDTEDSNKKKLRRLAISITSTTAITIEVKKGSTSPSAALKGLVFQTVSGTPTLYASEEQTDAGGNIRVWVVSDPATVSTSCSSGCDFFLVPAGPTSGGYTALGPGSLLGAYQSQIAEFTAGSSESTVGVTQSKAVTGEGNSINIQGIAKDTGANQFLFADATNKNIYKFDISGGGGGGGQANVARAMEDDGAFVWMVRDNTGTGGVDQLMKVVASGADKGTVVTGPFNLPSSGIEAIALDGGKIYAVDNNTSPPTLRRINTTTGAEETSSVYPKNLPFNVNEIGGAAAGSNIFLAERYNDVIHEVDPTTGNVVGSIPIFAPSGQSGLFTPFGLEGLARYSASENPFGNFPMFVGVKYNQFFRIHGGTGADKGKVLAVNFTPPGQPPFDMTAASINLIDSVPIVYVGDASTQQVYRTVYPGTSAPDATTKGTYAAILKITTPNPGVTQSTAASFTLDPVATLTLAITSPTANQGFSSSPITISGTVNDPVVTSVGITQDLPSTTLFGNPAKTGPSTLQSSTATADQNQYTKSEISGGIGWRFETDPFAMLHDFGGNILASFQLSGTFAYYGEGQPSNPNYDALFFPNQGTLDTAVFTVGTGTTVAFDTWYETEGFPEFDKKEISFCQGTPASPGSCTLMAQIVEIPGFGIGIAQGTVIATPPGAPIAAPKIILLSPGLLEGGAPAFKPITLSIPSSITAGTSGFVRFKFDTIDGFGNFFTGWFLDNIHVVGSGSLTLAAATVNTETDPPSWTLSNVAITEGANTVNVTASRSATAPGYPPALTTSATVTVFLDTQAPSVTVTAPNAVVSNASLTLSGSFVEATPDFLEVFLFNDSFPSGKSISKVTTLTAGTSASPTSFTAPATLALGTNTFKVLLKDKGAQCNTSPATNCTVANVVSSNIVTTYLDQTAPTVTVLGTAYPDTFVSARANDLVVFQLRATDVQGIASVKAASPSTPTVFNLDFRRAFKIAGETAIDPALGIPEAVQSQWGTNTDTTDLYLLPTTVGSAIPPGTLTLNVQATDNAGNVASTQVSATIVATAAGTVVNLMPGDNLISLPLIPSIANSATLEADLNALLKDVLSPFVPTQVAADDLVQQKGKAVRAGGATVSGLTVEVDWGDSTSLSSATTDSRGDYNLFHKYAASGNYVVNTTLKSGATTLATAMSRVNVGAVKGHVIDVSPTGTTSAAVTLNGAIVDTSGAAVSGATVTVDWGDSTTSNATTNTLGQYTLTHTYSTTGVKHINATSVKNSVDQGTGHVSTVIGTVDGIAINGVRQAVIDNILYYDSVTAGLTADQRWKVFTQDPALAAANTLTTGRTGKGYWVKARTASFKQSAPLVTGFSTTPAPIQLAYTGTFLPAGKTVPPTYPVVQGWNLIGFHSELSRLVSIYLQSLTVPTQVWASLYEFQNFIQFPLTAGGTPVVKLGAFNKLSATDTLVPSRGLWLYVNAATGEVIP